MAEPIGRRVLIVDDNDFSKEGIKKILESNGYEVVGLASGFKEALELYQSKKPDWVTLDLILGREYGFRTLMALKRIDPKARIIVISADSHPLTMEQASNLGAAGYVSKPVDWRRLREVIDRFQGEDYS